MLNIDDVIEVTLVPRNEADYPEVVKVKLKQKIPCNKSDDNIKKDVFIGSLISLPKQDFGYVLEELLIVYITYEDKKFFAHCNNSIND